MLENINEAEQDQKTDFARIEAAVNLAQEHLSALLDRCPGEEGGEWSAVRDRINRLLRDVRKRTKAADETRRRILETFVRDDEPLSRGALLSMVADLPTEALVDHLRYCLRVGDLTHARQVGAALSARDDRMLHEPYFEEVLAEWLLRDSGDDTLQRLVNICRLGEEAEGKIRALLATPGWHNGIPPGLPNEETTAAIEEEQDDRPNPITDQFISAPAAVAAGAEELISGIVVDSDECNVQAETVEGAPVCSRPLDALLDALNTASTPGLKSSN